MNIKKNLSSLYLKFSSSFIDSFKSLFNIILLIKFLPPARQWQILLAFVLIFFSSLLEFISLAAIIPIITLFVEPSPDVVGDSGYKVQFLDSLGLNLPIYSPVNIVILFSLVVILSTVIRTLSIFISAALSARIGIDFGDMLLKRISYMPYSKFISINSSNLISLLSDDVNGTLSAFLSSFNFLTSFFFLIITISGLLLYSPGLSLPIIILYSGFYLFLMLFASRFFSLSSKKVSDLRINALNQLQNTLSSFREMFVYNLQDFYRATYNQSNIPAKLLTARMSFLSSSPKIFLEAFAIITLISLAINLHLNGMSSQRILTSMGVLALASQKVLPAFQQLFTSFSVLQAKFSDTSRLLHWLATPSYVDPQNYLQQGSQSLAKVNLPKNISFDNVAFAYPDSNTNVFSSVSFTIPVGSRVGIVGSSGSGKSTIVDLILGLLKPSSGSILFVDELISEHSTEPYELPNSSSSRPSISVVPQDVFLTDGTVVENIAFGVKYDQIDMNRVKIAASNSCIDSFIESLPNGYNTRVGERGILLSGGQMQRIGIARALYLASNILILDEATSALDFSTESKVISSLNGVSPKITLIMIAHRLSTLASCDKIILLSAGGAKEFDSLQAYQDYLQ